MVSIDHCNWSVIASPRQRAELLSACEQVSRCAWLSEACEKLVLMLEPAWHVDLAEQCIRIYARDIDGRPARHPVICLV